MADRLIVRGAREHNLKDVSLDLPRDALIVFTGLSGSGKSSLAFDTIFAEGQRRYVESLSAYARQFLGQMDKPDVDFIEGLSPGGLDRPEVDVAATRARPSAPSPRSTTTCACSSRASASRTARSAARRSPGRRPQQIVDRVLEMPEGTRFQVLAPVVRGRKGEYVDLFADLQTKGYSRARVDGVVVQLDRAAEAEEAGEAHHRGGRRPAHGQGRAPSSRLTDSVETALRPVRRHGHPRLRRPARGRPEPRALYSEHLYCPYDDLSFEELEPRSFSFNSPFGACPECTGLGTRMEVDPELIVPDAEKTLDEGAIHPWSQRPHQRLLLPAASGRSADAIGFTHRHPVGAAARARRRRRCCTATKTQVHVRYRNRYGRRARPTTRPSRASIPYVQRRHSEAESDASRERFEGYMREVPCPTCEGARLKPVVAGGHGRRPVASPRSRPCRSASAPSSWPTLELTDREQADRRAGAQGDQRPAALPARRRPRLPDPGPRRGHPRPAARRSASGWPPRSAPAWSACSTSWTSRPSACTSATTTGCIETLVRLRDMGNTLIVVEHDEDTIRPPTGSSTSAPARASTAARSSSRGTVAGAAGQRGVD